MSEARHNYNSDNANGTLDSSSSSTLSNGLTITSNETIGDLLVSLGVVLTSPATDLISALGSSFSINEAASSGRSANTDTNSGLIPVTVSGSAVNRGPGGDTASAVNCSVSQGNQEITGRPGQGAVSVSPL